MASTVYVWNVTVCDSVLERARPDSDCDLVRSACETVLDPVGDAAVRLASWVTDAVATSDERDLDRV